MSRFSGYNLSISISIDVQTDITLLIHHINTNNSYQLFIILSIYKTFIHEVYNLIIMYWYKRKKYRELVNNELRPILVMPLFKNREYHAMRNICYH